MTGIEKMTVRNSKMKIDTTVKEMWIGILIWGILCELVMIWFVKDKAGCSLGLLIGCVLALAGVFHMWSVLDKALELGDGAQKFMTAKSLIRYAVFVVCFGVIMVTKWANPLTAFLGLMGIKMAAYLQPVIHRILTRGQKNLS